MKLPSRGFLANPDGQIIWAWEHNDPTTEFDAVPPFVMTMDGEVSTLASPLATVIDLDEEGLEPADLAPLLADLHNTRFRKDPDGSLRLTKTVVLPPEKVEPPLPGEEEPPPKPTVIVEVDHPVLDILNIRRGQRGKPPLKKGPADVKEGVRDVPPDESGEVLSTP